MVDASLWAVAVATLALVLVLSLGPEPPLDSFEFGDKLGHFVGYAAMTLSFLLAAVWAPVRGTGRFRSAGRLIPPAMVVLGALVELAQGFTLRRAPDGADAIADLLGVALGAGLWLVAASRARSLG